MDFRASEEDALSNLPSQARFRRWSDRVYAQVLKRWFDLAVAVLLIPVLLPVIAVLWAIVRADGGPGFFGHKRVGMDGKEFRCWKIRTMVPNAEEKLQALLARDEAAAAEWARDHKLTKDPRITLIGKFLRQTSLDELPQLWNVLLGDMSFVGPRPIVEAELEKYGAHQAAYLSMKPGVTGLWQVSGRNDVSYDERVAMDIEYLRVMSCGTDIKLMVKTFTAMCNRTGY
ncbi:sugar transferase [Salipiger pacificus]|nr:sugar transferase [Alloyangia mangrovi]MCA0942238.1 sugar transferase [Alloyangia pacifica]MCA0947487.1 sugar transferase [Alloyangia pacifica]